MTELLGAGATLRDATPRQHVDSSLWGGRELVYRDSFDFTASHTTSDYVRMLQLPSNLVLTSLEIVSPDIGTTLTVDVGLRKTPKEGGAVVDADFFQAALSLKDGAIALGSAASQILMGNIITVTNLGQKLFEQLSLTEKTREAFYDVCLTPTANSDGTGRVTLIAKGVIGP